MQQEGEVIKIFGEKSRYRIIKGIYEFNQDGVCRILRHHIYSDTYKYYKLAKGLSRIGLDFGKEYEFEITRKEKCHSLNGKKFGAPLYYAIPIVKFERIK